MSRLAILSTCCLALSLGACAGAKEALGLAKTSPDEFRVVTKAPLILPPDYALRPPQPGQQRPQELAPEQAARAAILGQQAQAARTEGENLLVAKAGGGRVDPNVRFVVDDENGDLAYKPTAFSNAVMFWQKGAATGAPLNADAEAKRLAAESVRVATGGGEVIIQRSKPSGFKLPGL